MEQEARPRKTLSEMATSEEERATGIKCRRCGCRDFRVRNTRRGDNLILR